MKIAIIVAASENNVIGDGKGMIWHIGEDLKRFKSLTMGHTMLMGRKTFGSIGRALPGRRSMVVTRSGEFSAPGCDIFHSIEEAISEAERSGEELLFVIGGGEIYRELWQRADLLYLTRVHATATGVTTIPEVLPTEWRELSRETHPATEASTEPTKESESIPPFTFINYERAK